MASVVEVTIVLKDTERNYKQKFLCYEALVVNEDNDLVQSFIAEAKKNFNGDPEEIIIRTVFQYQ